MNKKDICESLYQLRSTYHLDDAYLLKIQVVYDAAMVLRGIKSYCNDIDIRCIDEDIFEYVIHATKIEADHTRVPVFCMFPWTIISMYSALGVV